MHVWLAHSWQLAHGSVQVKATLLYPCFNREEPESTGSLILAYVILLSKLPVSTLRWSDSAV